VGGRALILLDTHALIWLDQQDRRLGPSSLDAIQQAEKRTEVAVSAITFWEAGMLSARRRIRLHRPLRSWRAEFLRAGLIEYPVTGDIGIVSAELENVHGDPADRLILATALAHGATLITADRRLLDWPGQLSRLDARA
jgi:PIN domain nuclease of toxin-antitoxin system